MKKIFSLLLPFVMLISIVSLVDFSAFAASMPTTTITSVKAQSKAFTVKWKKVKGINGYQIQYSTNKKFKKAKKITIKSKTTTSKTIKNIGNSKKYYIRIRSYKKNKGKNIYSNWSKNKVIKPIMKHCTNNNNHSIKCGNIGMWFGSRREVDTYFSSVCNKWGTKYKNEEITWEEYTKNCPQGYECWSCSYCGKWTGNFIKE